MDSGNLRQVYRRDPPNIFSVDYVDQIQGQGVIILYPGFCYANDSTISKVLFSSSSIPAGVAGADFPDPYDSADIETDTLFSFEKNVSTSGVYTQVGDWDFDIMVNKNFDVYGKCYVYTPFTDEFFDADDKGYVIWRLRRYRGTTETEIAYGKTYPSSNSSSAGIRAEGAHTDLIEIDVTTETRFIKGDILRMTLETWHSTTGVPTNRADIKFTIANFDPSSATGIKVFIATKIIE